jgi:curved DNA-binding protein CbpA
MDHYETLGVQRNATPQQIKAAYRKLAFAHHPDRNVGDPEAEARFKQAASAWSILCDPNKKAAYDAGLPQQPRPKPKPKKDVPEFDPAVHGDLIYMPPQPPKYDLWGKPLTAQEQQAWLINNGTFIIDNRGKAHFDRLQPKQKASNQGEWFDAFSGQYESGGSPDLR